MVGKSVIKGTRISVQLIVELLANGVTEEEILTEYYPDLEQNNSNMCHYLGRFTRRIKVVSKCEDMVDTSLKLWQALTLQDFFIQFQTTALSIYKQKLSDFLVVLFLLCADLLFFYRANGEYYFFVGFVDDFGCS
jgi:hypothetical protein